jgi:diguanylate cyclase (GGDEF)-like protein
VNSRYVSDHLDRSNLNMMIVLCAITGLANTVLLLVYLLGGIRPQLDTQFIGNSGVPGVWYRVICLLMIVWCAVLVYIGMERRQNLHQNHLEIQELMIANAMIFTIYSVFISAIDMINGNDALVFVFVEFWLYAIISMHPLTAEICSGISFIALRMFAGSAYSFRDFAELLILWIAIVVSGAISYALRSDQLAMREQYRTMNRQLKKDSLIDALTGLRNRRALRSDYEAYNGKELIVMMADIDNFKSYNDKFGHQAGDSALKMISEIMDQSFAKAGCYRYGGDEFLIVADGVTQDQFETAMASMRTKLADSLNVQHREPFTCSTGYVYGVCKSNEDLREMIHQADGQLYESKSVPGKNRSSCSPYVRGLDVSMTSAVPVIDDDDNTMEHHLW